MPRLESDAVAAALESKLKAVPRYKFDIFYDVYDKDGTKLCSTRVSHGPKETLGTGRVKQMARQLRLNDDTSLAGLVQCSLSGENALEMMRTNPRHTPYMDH